MSQLPPWKHCPQCTAALEAQTINGAMRLVCSEGSCGFIHWGNPTPVVAALIEHEGQFLLVRAPQWPEKVFGLVTGFLEPDESPEDAIAREIQEELSLHTEKLTWIDAIAFPAQNQVILAWHAQCSGQIQRSDELADTKHVPISKLRPWPFGTGIAVERWLQRQRDADHVPVS